MQLRNEEEELAVLKLAVIEEERLRTEAANKQLLEIQKAEEEKQSELDRITNEIVEKEKERKDSIERAKVQIVRNSVERGAQLEIVKKIIIEKEKKRKEAARRLSAVMETIEEETQVRKEVDRIMDLKDEKKIVEELCKLNKVNASKGLLRNSKSQKHMDGINKLIEDERQMHLKGAKNGITEAEQDRMNKVIQPSAVIHKQDAVKHEQENIQDKIEENCKISELDLAEKSIIEESIKGSEDVRELQGTSMERDEALSTSSSKTKGDGVSHRAHDGRDERPLDHCEVDASEEMERRARAGVTVTSKNMSIMTR